MEQSQMNSSEDVARMIDMRTAHLREMTQKMIDAEMGLIELTLSIDCLEKGQVKKAHQDTEKFKKAMMRQAKLFAKKNKSELIQEYKKLVNYI